MEVTVTVVFPFVLTVRGEIVILAIPNVYDNRCFVDVSAINYDIVDDTIESEKRKAIRFLKESIEGK